MSELTNKTSLSVGALDAFVFKLFGHAMSLSGDQLQVLAMPQAQAEPITKEWCMKMAELEGDHEISAGVLHVAQAEPVFLEERISQCYKPEPVADMEIADLFDDTGAPYRDYDFYIIPGSFNKLSPGKFKLYTHPQQPAEPQEPVAHIRHVTYEGIAKNGRELEAVLNEAFLHRFDITDGAELYLQTQRPAVPNGWKLVPIEPTEEMINAAMPTAFIGSPEAKQKSKDRWFASHRASLIEKYKTMLTAAPGMGR